MTTVGDVITAMDSITSPRFALPGDPIGLHSGKRNDRVQKVLLALDASLEVIAEAAKKNIDMLVVHHPRFYKGLATLSPDDLSGARAAAMAVSGLAVFSAHTNLDIAPGGVNDVLAGLAGLIDARPLAVTLRERLLKLAVFVPATHVEPVRKAVCDAGAGCIGAYSDCTFRVRGTGTFRCGAGTNPFIGKPGSYEEADEFCLETVLGEFSREAVIAAMLKAHPYEEAAYDLYPLERAGAAFGLGRAGNLAKAESVSSLARRLAAATGSTMAQFSGSPGRKVRRLAVWGGSGVDLKALAASGAEAIAAGEIGYHEQEALSDLGIAAITLGHGASEAPVLKPLAERLKKSLPGLKVGISRTPFAQATNASPR